MLNRYTTGPLSFVLSRLFRYFLVPQTKTILLQEGCFGKYFFYFFQTFFVGMKKTPVMAEAITGRPDEFKKGYFA